MSQALYLLFENASGYAIFERVQSDEIAQSVAEVQDSINDLGKFGKMIKLKMFLPFKSAAHALENINDVTEGIVNDHLKQALEVSLPKVKPGKKSSFQLGVAEPKLGGALEALGYSCIHTDLTTELLRGIRLHIEKLVNQFKAGDLAKAQLGLGHSYSRAKVKFNVNRVDNMIIQAVALVDLLDKDLNTFAMRVREWYSWHFPELVKIVPDNYKYARLVQVIRNKNSLTDATVESNPELVEITGDQDIAQQIIDAARISMGTDIADVDLINIETFAARVVSLAECRARLSQYLNDKMHNIAPNLSALIGEVIAARLISHAGSLTNLAKYPASTVQILGAEKALFRALKTKGNTPKYGLIYHSSFIGRAAAKNKGRISRYLANKCSIAANLDCFSETPTSKFGEALKQQVEQRLEFYDNGVAPTKNIDVMKSVISELESDKKKRKRDVEDEPTTPSKEKKKKKKKNKEEQEVEQEVETKMEVDTPKSEKKKKKKKSAE